jgi:hypothetical protein
MALRIYISGKISGVPNNNKEKFDAIEAKLIERGYEVVNPLRIDPGIKSPEWIHHMKADIKEMMSCHLVAVLDDWQDSRGALAEVNLAFDLSMSVVKADTLAMNGEFEHVKLVKKEVIFNV